MGGVGGGGGGATLRDSELYLQNELRKTMAQVLLLLCLFSFGFCFVFDDERCPEEVGGDSSML